MKNNTQEFKLCLMFKHSPNGKGAMFKHYDLWPKWNIDPMEKALWPQWKIFLWSKAPIEKAWFYEGFFWECK